MENKILSAVYSKREAYESIDHYIDKDKDLSEIGKIIYNLAYEYYINDPEAAGADKDIIKEIIKNKYEKHKEILIALIDSFTDVSIPNIVSYIKELKLSKISNEISAASGVGDIKKVNGLVDEYIKLRDTFLSLEQDDPFEFKGSKYYEDDSDTGEKLDILPKSVNEYLEGGITKQHHILIFGVPEVGKSLLTITIACGFLRQGKKVLYIGNEDPERAMRDRVRGCLLNCTKDKLYENPEEADYEADQKGYSLFGFAHLTPGSLRDVRSLCLHHQPDILIVDQVRNLNVPKNKDGNRVTQIETACQGIRNIAQELNLLAISVTQAADSAYNKLVLTMGDVYFSNTGAQAHADIMIGIGNNNEFDSSGQRMLSFPKNKINGRHGYFAVKVYPQIHKMVSI